MAEKKEETPESQTPLFAEAIEKMIEKRFMNTAEFFNELESINERMLRGAKVLLEIEDIEVAPTEKDLVFEEDKMKVFHYKPAPELSCSVSLLICYALVNRQYMMDLQSDRSLIRNLLNHGLDIFIIDWGYPDPGDRYLTMEDYIDVYLNDAVDAVRGITGLEKINLLGVCQGGTFSGIYSALYPEKIASLITMVAPFDFSTTDGLLHVWSRYMPIDEMVDVMGIIPGEFMNVGFLLLKPFQLMVDKYIGLMDNLDDKDIVENFVRMEKWIFDSPAQAGEAYRKFLKDLYQENKLVKGELELGGRTVNLKNITMPVMNIYALQDHLVPPAASRPFTQLIGSKDKEEIPFPGGHIGIYVSSKSQNELAPRIAEWLNDHCDMPAPQPKRKTAARKTTAHKPKAS